MEFYNPTGWMILRQSPGAQCIHQPFGGNQMLSFPWWPLKNPVTTRLPAKRHTQFVSEGLRSAPLVGCFPVLVSTERHAQSTYPLVVCIGCLPGFQEELPIQTNDSWPKGYTKNHTCSDSPCFGFPGIWPWANTNGIPFWGRCNTHFRTYSSGWIEMFTGVTIWVLTHSQMRRLGFQEETGRPLDSTTPRPVAAACGLQQPERCAPVLLRPASSDLLRQRLTSAKRWHVSLLGQKRLPDSWSSLR